MEKKKSPDLTKGRLRLVKPEDEVSSVESTQTGEVPHRSAFVRQMTQFADQMDRMIEDILRA